MTFEELFKKKQEPSNYVEYPPKQPVNALDKFFQERTPAPKKQFVPTAEDQMRAKALDQQLHGEYFPEGVDIGSKPKAVAKPIKDELKVVAQTSAPVTEDTVSKYREMFMQGQLADPVSTARESELPEQQPQQQPQQQYIPAQSASNMIDVNRVKEQAEVLAPSNTWGDLALGLIPLAVDAFTGGTGAGMGIAGDYYMNTAKENQKRKQTLEDKLMEIEKSRAIASAKARGEGKLYEGLVGDKPTWMTRDQAIGQGVYKSPGKNGLTEEQWMAREKYKAELKAKLADKKLTEEQKEAIVDHEMKLATEWEKHDFTKGTRKVADSYKRIMNIDPNNQKDGNPVEDMGLIFDLMKSLDPQSVVRESEQAMAIGARSYEDVVKYFESLATGERKLSPPQVRNIQKFASSLYVKRMQSQDQVNAGYISKAKKWGLDPSTIVQKIGDKVPVLWQNRKTKEFSVLLFNENEVDEAVRAGAKRF